MNIIKRRLNSTYIRKNELKNIINKSKSKDKDKTVNVINGYNKINIIGNILNTNRNKTKLVKNNKKVKFSLPINIKNNKINDINKTINNNSKKNIIHRHTKSSFIQEPNLLLNKLIKDNNISNINNNILNNDNNNISISNRKKISLNNFMNYNNKINTKNNSNKKRNKKVVSKLNKNNIKNFQSLQMQKSEKKDSLRNDLINSYREPINNNTLVKIIEELKLENKKNENGFSKKFIEAQNNWRKNYFATVIQKLYRGYHFRKTYNISNKNIKKDFNIKSAVYIKKKAKDNNYICTAEKNKNKIPHKIKEIVISIKSNKGYLNNNIYYNNDIHQNLNDKINNSAIKNVFNVFNLWREYTDKIGILKKLKIFKKYKKNVFRNNSYEKQRNKTLFQS